MCRFAFIADELRATNGTALNERYRGKGQGARGKRIVFRRGLRTITTPLLLVPCLWLLFPNYLRNNLASLFHQHTIAYMKVETGHHIGIVEGCPANLSASQLYRIHVSDRRNSPGSADLKDNLPECCLCLFCLELIGNRPSRTLGCHAKALLLSQRIDFQHDTIGCDRQVTTFLVPIIDILIHFFQSADQPHVLAYLKAPSGRSFEVLIVTIARNAFAQ